MTNTSNPDASLDLSTDPASVNELAVLKERARLMGIQFSPNIGVEALRQRIEAKMTSQPASPETNPLSTGANDTPVVQREMTLREKLIADAMRLVRLRITNLDPKKKDLPGEILTVANEYIGTVRKFIPYGEVTDNGYHVPYVLYEMLKEKEFLNIRVTKNSKGQEVVRQGWVREFALEELPPLTPKELADLKAAQQAAGVGDDNYSSGP